MSKYRYPLGPGECPDIKGRPIYPGDLVRTYHFTDPLRRRKCYLYHVATLYDNNQGFQTIQMIPVHRLAFSQSQRKSGDHVLSYEGVLGAKAEIISGLAPEDPRGPEYGLLSFYERPKIGPPLK